MPKSVGDFIVDIAQKAGIPKENEHLTALLASDADLFNKYKIPDELATQLDSTLVSLKSAKENHPDIKNHYFAAAYNGLDSEIDSLMDEMGVPDDLKLVVKNEKSSTKRAALLTRKIKELEAAKKNTDSKGEKESLQNTINQLNTELRATKDGIEGIKSEYDKKYKALELRYALNDLLGEYKTVFDEMPKPARNAAINALIEKALQDKNAEFTMDENGQIKLVRKDGANVFGDDNRPWDSRILIDHTLSQNKILKINDSKPQNQQQQSNTSIITNSSDNSPKKDARLSALVNDSLKDLEGAGKVAVM